jgi:hypothetical protein
MTLVQETLVFASEMRAAFKPIRSTQSDMGGAHVVPAA